MPFANAAGQIVQQEVDRDEQLERGVLIPWASDPSGSYVYYDCTLGSMLDSGIVVHNRLPQVDRAADTLGSVQYGSVGMDIVTSDGVNLRCQDQYEDIKQRMGHARYWFRLWGQALRVGYKIPIPFLKTVGGVEVIPYDKNPQWGFNRIFPGGNYSGIILWHAVWSLWYTTLVQPYNNNIPAVDLMAHIGGDAAPPEGGIQAPWSGADDNAGVAVQGGAKPRR